MAFYLQVSCKTRLLDPGGTPTVDGALEVVAIHSVDTWQTGWHDSFPEPHASASRVSLDPNLGESPFKILIDIEGFMKCLPTRCRCSGRGPRCIPHGSELSRSRILVLGCQEPVNKAGVKRTR